MPLTDDTLARISQWFMTHSPVSQLADNRKDVNAARGLKNCQHWAIRGLSDNPRADIQHIMGIISEGKRPPGLELIADDIHATFGNLWKPKIVEAYDAKTRLARDALRPKLHELTAAIFEYCLKANGFQLVDRSDYVVCMEYDCESNTFMYPNFTHAWLAYRNVFVVQKVPDRYVSISMREAARSPLAGVIRRPVADFLPEQIEVIEDIVAHPIKAAANHVTTCYPRIGSKRDVMSPNEVPQPQLSH